MISLCRNFVLNSRQTISSLKNVALFSSHYRFARQKNVLKKMPHLVLHFDINETLTLKNETHSSSRNKTVSHSVDIFPSFFNLLQNLRKSHMSFVVILRTFGENLKETTERISSHPQGIQFHRFGTFEKDALHFQEGEVIRKMDQIFQVMSKTNVHIAIQDDWKKWMEEGANVQAGKPFPFDSKDRTVLSLFFDDSDVVNPIDIRGGQTSHWKNRLVFKVNPQEALSNDKYFIHLVHKALLENIILLS